MERDPRYWDECARCEHYWSEHDESGCRCWVIDFMHDGECSCAEYVAA